MIAVHLEPKGLAHTALPLISEIQRAVAKRYRVPVSIMVAPGAHGDRVRRYVWPRQVAIELAARLTDHSLVRIGYFFGGRDHSTIIHSRKAVEKRRAKNPKLHETMRRLTLDLISTAPSTIHPQSGRQDYRVAVGRLVGS